MSAPRPCILLVEDDENDVLLAQRAFRKMRIANPLQVVRNGEEAVQYLGGAGAFADRVAHPLPALVLMDIKMPRKTGHEVLEWLKAQPGLKRIPVVMLTSSSRPEDINRAYEMGANSYLVKPLSTEGLNELVKTLNLYWLVLNEPPGVPDEG